MKGNLFEFERFDGAVNMAIDQAILESTLPEAPATLRFYGWKQPTLSLGYFQKYGGRKLHSPSKFVACVRRATGGGAIVHHHELTYSLVWPVNSSAAKLPSTGARGELYQAVHQSIVSALDELGVQAARFADEPRRLPATNADASDPVTSPGKTESFLCFQRRTDEDLIVAGYKVLGSAQRTSRNAVLQHGSLLLEASRFAPELPGIFNLSGTVITLSELTRVLARHVSKRLGVEFEEPRKVSHAELDDSIEQIVESRFGIDDWTRKRR